MIIIHQDQKPFVLQFKKWLHRPHQQPPRPPHEPARLHPCSSHWWCSNSCHPDGLGMNSSLEWNGGNEWKITMSEGVYIYKYHYNPIFKLTWNPGNLVKKNKWNHGNHFKVYIYNWHETMGTKKETTETTKFWMIRITKWKKSFREFCWMTWFTISLVEFQRAHGLPNKP